MPNLWEALEQIRGLYAVLAEWRACAGDDFEHLQLFLQPLPTKARHLPCDKCGCQHEVIPLPDGSIASVCRCKRGRCPDQNLTVDDVTHRHLNLPKFARAICKAFGLASKFKPLGIPNTAQIGCWSVDEVPAILTLQATGDDFHHVVTHLIAQLHERFILLAPTAPNADAVALGFLANAKAQLFALDANLILTPNGTLQPRRTPGEIFARFTPGPEGHTPEDVARNAFALLQQLDPQSRRVQPSVLTVFRLYCVEEKSIVQIARQCRCSRLTIIRRLNFIRKKTGTDPKTLRRFSNHIAEMDDRLSHSRAERIHRKGAIYG